jgi:hypothetical protein
LESPDLKPLLRTWRSEASGFIASNGEPKTWQKRHNKHEFFSHCSSLASCWFT